MTKNNPLFFPEHIAQGTHLCGPACVESLLRSYGITAYDQYEIAYKFGVYKEDWGSPPDKIVEFLSKLFNDVGINFNSTFEELSEHITAGLPSLTLIQDIFPEKDGHNDISEKKDSEEDGHYVIVVDVARGEDREWVVVSDPSNTLRQYDDEGFVRLKIDPKDTYEFRPFYKIERSVFESIWYDKFENGKVEHGVIIWFDPLSIKNTNL